MSDKKDKPKLKIVSNNKPQIKNKLTAKQLGFSVKTWSITI